MQLQFSRRSDKDLDRLYEFLTEASHSIKTADKALKAIKDGATSLLDRPRYGNGPAGRHRAQRVVYSIWEKQLYSALQNRLRGESNPAFADLAQLGRKEINSMDCEADDSQPGWPMVAGIGAVVVCKNSPDNIFAEI